MEESLNPEPKDQFDENLPSISEASGESRSDVSRDLVHKRWYFWHRKLGHMPEEFLKNLTINTTGVQLQVPERSSFEDCAVCQELPPIIADEVTKQRRTDRPLSLLHLHVSKPFPTDPSEEKPFVMLIVDDFTNYCQVNFCHNELDMLLYLEDFIEESKYLFTTRVDVVQLEGLTFEFYHLALKWLKLKKIGVSTTCKLTRGARPKAAHLLDIVVRTAKALLSDSSNRDFFWKEAIEAATYLVNATTIIDGITPYEHWFGRRPSLEKIKRFGTYVFDENRTDAFRTQCIYLGLEHHFHKVWDPILKTSVFHLNVVAEDQCADENETEQLLQPLVEGREEDREMKDNLTNKYRRRVGRRRRQDVFANLVKQYEEYARLRCEVFENILNERQDEASDVPRVRYTLDNRDYRRVSELALSKRTRPLPEALAEPGP